MTKRDFESKKTLVQQYLVQAKRYSKIKYQDLLQDDEKRLAIERALFLVVQATIDLAEAYTVVQKYRRASSMHEAIDILRENGVIDEDLCERLLKMVGFRNVLTHGYSKLDYKKVVEVLRNGLKDIEKLLKAL